MVEKISPEREKVLRVIDYINHHNPGSAKVTGSYNCEDCGHNFPDGTFNYDRGGYAIDFQSNILLLSSEKIDFPLRYFHVLGGHDASEAELSSVEELFLKSESWQLYEVPYDCLDTYVDVMKTNALVWEAGRELTEYLGCVHSTHSFTEQEMRADPDKREVVEIEKEILSKPDIIIDASSSDIEYLSDHIRNGRSLPKEYDPAEQPIGLSDDTFSLNLKLSFIVNTYDTLKAKNLMSPVPKVTEAINKIGDFHKPLYS